MSQTLTWVEISQSALKHNIKLFKNNLKPGTQLMVVVKSNAYGHGMFEVAVLAAQTGADWLATVNLDEAIQLRQQGVKLPILVLSYYDLEKSAIKYAINKNISLVVYDIDQVKFIDKIASKLNKKARVHIKIDTGTSRIGIMFDEAVKFVEGANSQNYIGIEGIFSHFASSEEDQDFTNMQLERFKKLISELEKKNIKIKFKHFACSAAIMSQPESHFDLVRLGVSAYGLWPSEQARQFAKKNLAKDFDLKPAMSLYTKIVQLKNIKKGSCVGYGCSYKVKRDTKLAILPIGYWEGFDRHLSNKGEILIGDKRCAVLGRVCMNLIMIDVTDLDDVKVGERVVILGRDGNEKITAEELADKIGTINYEVVTRINPLIPRLYVE